MHVFINTWLAYVYIYLITRNTLYSSSPPYEPPLVPTSLKVLYNYIICVLVYVCIYLFIDTYTAHVYISVLFTHNAQDIVFLSVALRATTRAYFAQGTFI